MNTSLSGPIKNVFKDIEKVVKRTEKRFLIFYHSPHFFHLLSLGNWCLINVPPPSSELQKSVVYISSWQEGSFRLNLQVSLSIKWHFCSTFQLSLEHNSDLLQFTWRWHVDTSKKSHFTLSPSAHILTNWAWLWTATASVETSGMRLAASLPSCLR